jgi:HD-GYP domain-containing protein (c-di-GMP phosphodiesterase class II)
MRYVPVNCITEGMIVGKRLIGKNGELLLNTGTVIRSSYIKKIKELGYSGLYIADDVSSDIEIVEVISEELRFKTATKVQQAFTEMERKTAPFSIYLDAFDDIVSEIIDRVFENRDAMINMLDLKAFDDYTYLHSTNVAVLSIVLGATLNINVLDLHKLGLSALLHDIGKVFVPKELLNKPSRLNEEEFSIMKTHSSKGYEFLKSNYEFPMSSYLGVFQHHEKYDGTGYPVGLSGKQIHIFGRIIAITDVYDALTSSRPYRDALLPSEAIEYIMANGGTHFDPEIVNKFTTKIAPYPVGMTVKLSNNTSGIVMENYSKACLRPKIKIIKHGNSPVLPYIMDLNNDPSCLNITITGIDYNI